MPHQLGAQPIVDARIEKAVLEGIAPRTGKTQERSGVLGWAYLNGRDHEKAARRRAEEAQREERAREQDARLAELDRKMAYLEGRTEAMRERGPLAAHKPRRFERRGDIGECRRGSDKPAVSARFRRSV